MTLIRGLLLCSLLYVPLAVAQTPDTSTIRGRVLDPDQHPIAHAHVTVTNILTGLARRVDSDAAGDFTVAGLPIAGSYRIAVTATGFSPGETSNAVLEAGVAARVDLALAVAGGNTRVVVTGEAGSVRTDEPQMGEVLSSRQMEKMPLLNRRITFLPLLNAANRPAINQGDIFMNEDLFTTNGAGRRQTWFEADGGNANDSWGRQTIFSNIPLDAVEEMTVLENSFSAEYGASTGSVVNIVTKSGSNQFHGMALGLWRPSGPEAELSGFNATNATSGNDLANDTLGQAAASISGPLGRSGRTQFFLSGEYSSEDKASPVTSPIAPGNFIGRYRGGLGFLRIDHEFSARNRAFLREDDDMFYDTNPNGIVGGSVLPTVARTFRRRTYTTEVGDTAVLSPTLVNDLRAQVQLASPITEFNPVIYGTEFSVPISSGGTFTSGTSQQALLMNHQYEFNDVLSADWHKHQVRFGGSLIAAHTGGDSKEFGGPIYDGEFIYNTCPASDTAAYCESPAYLDNINNVQTYTQSYGNADYTVTDFIWALFAQDDYQLRPNLTLNFGLRYEQQTFTDARDNFAPRIGFDYDLGGRGQTVLRGGFGIYYSQIVDNSEANYALTGPTGVFNYTAAPGQVGFPTSVAAAPLPAFPPGAVAPLRSLYIRPGRSAYYDQFFPTSTLENYPNKLLNPYSEQWTLGVQRQLEKQWVLSVDYVGTHTLRNVRPLDVDPPTPFIRTAQGQTRTPQAANCTRPYWIYWYAQHNMTCNSAAATNPEPPYSVIQSDVNDGFAEYNALDVNLNHHFEHGSSLLASYSWSHTLDNVDPDVTSQNPNDPNFTGRAEYGNAIYDQRNRFVLSGVYAAPFRFNLGGIATLASGLPYNIVTGTTNSGDTGATTDRPIIDGQLVGRDTGRGAPIYDISPFIERDFVLSSGRIQLNLRAEAFNATNHANFVGYSGTYGNGATPGAGFGQPLTGVTNQLPARELQFSSQISF